MSNEEESAGHPKIEIETPFRFSGSDLEAWLRKNFSENTFDFSVNTNDLLHRLEDLPRIEEHTARQLEEEYRRALEHLAKFYMSAAEAVRREIEAQNDPDQKKELQQILRTVEHRMNELGPFPSHSFPIESRIHAAWSLTEPSVIHAIRHGAQVINVVLKTPAASAILGATAKQLVDSVVKWLKTRHEGQKVEVRLFGPDGKLIERRKVD